MASLSSGFPARPTCANQADSFGRWKDCPLGRVCRNFRAKPPTPKGETVRTIPLGDGYYAYVDAADYEWLSQWNWYLQGGYAVRRDGDRWVYMHREIAQPPEGMLVDHKNRNKLDNTRDNLRVCTRQENQLNLRKRSGARSRFKGVYYDKRCDKWYARCRYKGKHHGFGYYDDEVEAARAYDRGAVGLFGEFARLNFPEEWPPERRTEVYAMRQAGSGQEGKR